MKGLDGREYILLESHEEAQAVDRTALGRTAAQLEEIGQPMPVEDSYIAAIAIRHNLTAATANEKDFRHSGIKMFNSFEETGSAD